MPKSKETDPLEFALGMIRERERMNKQIELPEWLDKELWAAFVDMRRKMGRRQPFTEFGQRLILNKLERFVDWGYDANESLRESIARGWSGVFPQGEPKRKEWKSGSAQLSADDKDYYRKLGLIQ